MNTQEKLDLAQWVVDRARALGADHASASMVTDRSVSVEYRDGQLDTLTDSTERSVAISLFVKGRYSRQTTSDLSKDSLSTFIEQGIVMTSHLAEDPARALPDPSRYEGRKDIDLQIYDDSYSALTIDRRKEIAQEIGALAADKGGENLISVESGHDDSMVESILVTSNGFSGSRRYSHFAAGASVTVRDGDKGRPSDYAWSTTCHHRDLPTWDALASEAVERANSRIGQSKMESAKLTAIVENRVASRLLGGFWSALYGYQLQQKNSFLEGKLGESVGVKAFTLADDPHLVRGLGSRLFDREGMSTEKRFLVQDGQLTSYLLNTYYGNKLGMTPTIGSPCNLVMGYGDRSLDEIVADVQAGILVRSFIGGNSNSATGDFSYGVIGDYVEGGKIVRPVNEMNVSGNYADLFNRLSEVGNDPYVYSSRRFPCLRFDDVQFAGM